MTLNMTANCYSFREVLLRNLKWFTLYRFKVCNHNFLRSLENQFSVKRLFLILVKLELKPFTIYFCENKLYTTLLTKSFQRKTDKRVKRMVISSIAAKLSYNKETETEFSLRRSILSNCVFLFKCL